MARPLGSKSVPRPLVPKKCSEATWLEECSQTAWPKTRSEAAWSKKTHPPATDCAHLGNHTVFHIGSPTSEISGLLGPTHARHIAHECSSIIYIYIYIYILKKPWSQLFKPVGKFIGGPDPRARGAGAISGCGTPRASEKSCLFKSLGLAVAAADIL